MYVWKADNVHRTRAIPHIKTYTKVKHDRAAYFVLTSSNLSKAAWGRYNKDRSKLFIMSHEAGVLFLPRFTDRDHEDCGHDHGHQHTYILGQDLDLPYDLPLTKYVKGTDKPFYHNV